MPLPCFAKATQGERGFEKRSEEKKSMDEVDYMDEKDGGGK